MIQLSGGPAIQSGKGWILAALMCTMMLAAMDTTIVSTAIPSIVVDLGGFSLFSWVYSVYLLAQTVTIPLYGKLADVYGRKPVLLWGTFVFLVGSVASGASWNMMSLIAFRGLQGLGAGSILATVNTIAGDIYTVQERATIQGWLSSVWGIAAIAGPAIGGLFAQYGIWRWIFYINVPIGITALILLIVFFNEHVESREHYINGRGIAIMTLSGVSVIFTLMQTGQIWAVASYQTLIMVMISVGLIIITVRTEQRSPEPILPGWIWKNRVLLGANLAIVCMGAMMLGPNMYLPVYAQSVMGQGALAAGFILASMSIGWPVASSYSGRLYLRIGFRSTALIGASIVFAASVGFVLIPFNSPVYWVVLDQVMLGVGFGLLSTPTIVGVQSVVAWQQRGVVTGVHIFSRYIGQSIGAAVLGGIFNISLQQELHRAPRTLQSQLPTNLNLLLDVMLHPGTSNAIHEYLQLTFYGATQTVYIAMACIGILVILFLLLQPAGGWTVNEEM
ncbi:MAG: Multidrug resistance protein 3 [Chlorobi bacterium]|nr:MAG: major facilitator superfamily MFS_1 [Chlorobi bacterium OLB6]MBV6462917.1 Multidrug resistance protein 3 [Chlorobiota bacterium]